MKSDNYVAIMAGGIGSRFWPMSRSAYPKQFLDILQTGKTLLQSTYERFLTFIPNENIYIVTSEEYAHIVREQLPHLPVENIIGEPEKKNTAPCVLYIALKIRQLNPAANLVIAPSDHVIEEFELFKQNCLLALSVTEKKNVFITLGIVPTYANTGYGYIQFDKEAGTGGVFPVKRFAEKPDLPTATAFFDSGVYLWNAGIFIWKADDIIAAFKEFKPAMYDLFQAGIAQFNTPGENAFITDVYTNCEPVSIDYAVMEKATNVEVIPAAFKWSDLGTWNSAWENFEKDDAMNAVAGDNTLVIGARGCFVHSDDKKLLLVGGVEDLIIVNTPDAMLICKKENEQQLKEYLAKLKETKGTKYL